MQQYPLMNSTKWDEVRWAMYRLRPKPRWRIRDVESGDESNWDAEWFYHFGSCRYDTIEWLEIETATQAQRDAVLEALRQIHVPGQQTECGVLVFGYASPDAAIDYL